MSDASQGVASAAPCVVLSDVMVMMRDGVCLATDIYFPPGYRIGIDAPLPTLLERTPYGKTEVSRSERRKGQAALPRAQVAVQFARHGYAVIYQDCRGRHASEGHFTKYLSEGPDGYDTMQWAARQPWSTGRFGTMGLSYSAHTQMALACLNPPGLSCMVIDSGGFSNAHQCGIRQGGAFELKQAVWACKHAMQSPAALADPLVMQALQEQDLHAWFARMPWRPGHSPLRFSSEYENYLFEQWNNESFDEYWQQLGIHAAGYYDTMADIPVVLMSSWYDAYVATTTENYQAFSSRRTSPVQLIMGPWLHGDRNISYSGDVEFGDTAIIDGQIAEDWVAFRLQWFDRWMKPAAAGVPLADAPAARVFMMGGGSGTRNAEGRMEHGGRWIQAESWPLPATRFVPFHLHADGRLGADAPQVDAASISYTFDPAHPVPTIGGSLTSGAPIFEGGAFDQREDERFFGISNPGIPLAARPDVVVFESEVLTQDTAVAGNISVRLWVSSDAPDTDFTAKLIDVYPMSADYPQGYAMNLTDGIFRCRFHESWQRPVMLEAGRVYEICIEAFATCNLFKKGHRIRLDISSSNFPHFDVNTNSGENPATARRKQVAVNTLHLDRHRPSHVLLPLVDVAGLEPLADISAM